MEGEQIFGKMKPDQKINIQIVILYVPNFLNLGCTKEKSFKGVCFWLNFVLSWGENLINSSKQNFSDQIIND